MFRDAYPWHWSEWSTPNASLFVYDGRNQTFILMAETNGEIFSIKHFDNVDDSSVRKVAINLHSVQ